MSNTSGVEQSVKLLDSIVPQYDPQIHLQRGHASALDALEQYSRYLVQSIHLPENYLSKYTKLVAAINNMPQADTRHRDEIIAQFPWLNKHIELLESCVLKYQEILSGKEDAMSVLFPDGSFKLVEPVYKDNPISDYFNDIVGIIVQKYLSQNPNRDFRIIEIGAGTGSTTKHIFEHITSSNLSNLQYYFTDISHAFLNRAKEKFSEYPNIHYQLYNIESNPTAEMIEGFDVVIATNVLHATSNIVNTLENVYKLLKDKGILVLNEVTSRQDFATLTFGLTEGWWLFEDHRIPDSPLIDVPTWKHLLHKVGFKNVINHGPEEQSVFTSLKDLSNKTNTTEKQNNSEFTEDGQTLTDEAVNPNVKSFVLEVISKTMKIGIHELSTTAPFSEYGIDSLIVLELLKPLREKFGYLPSTIFFEYPSVEKLSEYLSKNYKSTSPSPNFTIPSSETTKNKYQKLKAYIRHTISDVMKIPVEQINNTHAFREYGIDSLISLEILKPFKKDFAYLPSTLLFEYPTVDRLYEFFTTEKKDIVDALFASSPSEEHNDYIEVSEEHPTNTITTTGEINDIAIIGIAGIFPGANSVNELWHNLLHAECSISDIPIERWNNAEFTQKNRAYEIGDNYSSVGGFINGIEYFDHEFFNITPLDAENMDPQERLFLQESYHAFEDSGYSIDSLSGKNVGVFVGVMNGGYAWLGISSDPGNWADSLYWSIANRVSYTYNFHGPSLAIDTACSSSLSALHQACLSINSGDCSMALVGGVNLIVHPKQYTKLSRLSMLSKSNTCKPFGKDADGFIDGEGIISIVVKSLQDAQKDNDKIYGVIKGSAINAGGKANGYSAPNPDAQANLMKSVLKKSSITPEEISYIEAHGTGTELGDPVEVRGLSKVFENFNNNKILMGTIKSNMGHLESAAGLAGLIKILLQIRHGKIAPSLNSNPPNPHINFDSAPLRVAKEIHDWKVAPKLRTALLNSYGAGGANASIVIQEYINITNSYDLPYYIIPISAKSRQSLILFIVSLLGWCKGNSKASIHDLSAALANRDHYQYRIAFCIQDVSSLINTLEKLLKSMLSQGFIKSTNTQKNNPSKRLNISRESLINSHNIKNDLEDIAHAYMSGYIIDWVEIYPSYNKLHNLPKYEFEKNYHWIPTPRYGLSRNMKLIHHHKIQGEVIVPGSKMLSDVFKKANNPNTLNDICWIAPMTAREESHWTSTDNKWELHSTSSNHVIFNATVENTSKDVFSLPKNFDSLLGSESEVVLKQELYEMFYSKGYKYGPLLQKIAYVVKTRNQALGVITTDDTQENITDPCVIDAGLQVVISMFESSNSQFLPFYAEEIMVTSTKLPKVLFCYCERTDNKVLEKPETISFNMVFFDEEKNVVMTIKNMTSKSITNQSSTNDPKLTVL